MTPESAGQLDVKSYLRILWRWKLLFLAFVVLIPLGTYFLERGKQKLYQSNALIQPLNASVSTTSPGTTGSIPATSLLAAARLVTTTPVAQTAAAFLHPPASPSFLLGEVSASANVNTGFLTITAQDHDPDRAAAIANAFGAALSSHEAGQANHTIDAQLSAFVKQLASTPANDTPERASLIQEIATLRALRNSMGGGAQVIESAVPSSAPAVPNTRRAVEIALVIALLLGLGAVLVADSGDRRVRTAEALERLSGTALLGTIPRSAFSPRRQRSGREDEAFQMLRAALGCFKAERSVASIAIVSPGPEDGKTTVAVGLAVATARAGGRAVLVDADLRRAAVCDRLGISSGAGLGAVLANERELSDVLIEYPIQAAHAGRLFVLPAGPPPPNPSALLSTQEMARVLRRLEAHADLVIVDTPAALAVSDALPLLQQVSEVVMVVRLNHSSRVAMRRLLKVISSAGRELLGVVATGCPAADGYLVYGRYYGAPGHRRHRILRPFRRRRRATVATGLKATNGSARSSSQSVSSVHEIVTLGGGPAAAPPTGYQPHAAGPESRVPDAVSRTPAPNGAPSAEPEPDAGLSDRGGHTAAQEAAEQQNWRTKTRRHLSRFG